MLDIVLATRNRDKVRELTALLAMRGIRYRSLAAHAGVPAVPETGRTFEANAITKARAVAKATGCVAIADDSGLEVDALDGNPGVRSARFAGRHGDDAANNAKVLRDLQGVPPARRRARYRCVLALASPAHRGTTGGASPARLIGVARGSWHGRIALAPAGLSGFGYDPLFVVPALGKTVGELSAATKQRLSHRARAARRMLPVLRQLTAAEPRSSDGGPRRGYSAGDRPGRARAA